MTRPYTLTAVREGQTATFACDDNTGWQRRPVPCDGLLIEGDDTTVFIPCAEVLEALNTFRKHRGRK
jgi:hypothetical protein